MPESHELHPEVRSQHRALTEAHQYIVAADEVLARMAEDLAGPSTIARRMLRTIGRVLDEAGTTDVHHWDPANSNERTNRELRAVLSDLGIPADRRAFDISAEVQALIASDDFERNGLARERLRHLRDVLNAKDFR